ncbi:MAG: hypothetical protein FD155_1214 [Bacteroidetes bacterium]|nr:MAG: hypothetical protein FD155_1214 [Bacteroidota bacterium]
MYFRAKIVGVHISKIRNVILIGTGRVSWNLGNSLKDKGIIILEVAGRSFEKVNQLSKKFQSKAVTDFQQINPNADLYILAVSDDAIEEVASQMPFVKGILVHTSGMKDSVVLTKFFTRTGVFYPLQTFSFERQPEFNSIPVFVQSSDEGDLTLLRDLAEKLSSTVVTINDEQRQRLHLAAVFVNNFTNALYLMADQILVKDDLSIDYLKPLMIETAMKAMNVSPEQAQTGPARRNDQGTIAQHLELLTAFPELQEIYKNFSAYILTKYNRKLHE